MTSSFILNCDSEVTAIKLDLCDDSNGELEAETGYLNVDNLKQEPQDSDVIEISVSNVSEETKSSPLSKSRYGRIHKPKFDEDFLSTDKKVGAILGILCTPQKSSGPSSKTSTPKKLWQSPNGSVSDITTDPDTSGENIFRTFRDICEIFSPQTENFRGFGRNKSGEIPSSLNCVPECNWMPGDLAWARVGNHPYWPCIVTVDPMVQTFKKINLRGLKCCLLVHVQFYGDKGRHSWLSSSAMQKYEGLEAFNKLCEEMIRKCKHKYRKLREPYIVRTSVKMKWDIAVSESEAVYSMTRDMRLLEFISKYPNIPGDDFALLTPEQEMNMQVKRKADVSSGSHFSKKVRVSQEGGGGRAFLVKKKLSLPDDDYDTAYPEKKKKEALSLDNVKALGSPPTSHVARESLPEKKKVQATLEQFFSFSRSPVHSRATSLPKVGKQTPDFSRDVVHITELPRDEVQMIELSKDVVQITELPDDELQDSSEDEGVPTSKSSRREKFSEIRILSDTELLPPNKTLHEEEGVPKYKQNEPPEADMYSDNILESDMPPKMDVTPKSRKSLRLNSLKDRISVKPEVSSLDKALNMDNAHCAPDVLADTDVPQKCERLQSDRVADKDNSSDEWLPSKRNGRQKDGPASSEVVSTPSSQQNRGKAVSEEEEAFYQFSLVHTQIVMDDNPYWSKDKVESYVRILWNNLDDDDKTKFGKRTDAEKKKDEGGKEEKPAKRLYARKKKEVDVSDAESTSSSSSEELEVSKDDASSLFTFRERKPASLFRGMKNEKVCQVCEVPGDTVKCKGPCLGFYHLACLPGSGAAATPVVGVTSTDAVVSSDSGVEESDSDAGDVRASNGGDATSTVLEAACVTPRRENAKTTHRILGQDAAVVGTGGDSAKKLSAKKKAKKTDKDEDSEEDKASSNFVCPKCVQGILPPCFACSKDLNESGDEKKLRCVVGLCSKVYHLDCLQLWPQAWYCSSRSSRQDDLNLTCPQHTCHTCASDDPRNFNTRFANERLVRCVRCPTAYHYGNYCVPAGSIILNTTQIICSRHCNPQRKGSHHVNASWCFICAMGRSSSGGSLICCDLCPMSFHAECLNISAPEGGYICEDCGTGRFPLYGEIVWAKLGNYRWWPAQIVFPDQIPENIDNLQHSDGEFVVRFFGSHDYNWVNRSRVFLYQEGDSAYKKSGKTSVDTVFLRAVGEAHEAHQELNLAKASREAEPRQAMKPPQYVKIKSNKPVGNVRVIECDPSSLVPCYCDPKKENPCGPDSDCLNRILMVECSPLVCRAGEKCRNQRFEKREYPPLMPYKTDGRGWGLKTLSVIKKGDFVIEYVGEMIDEAEYKRRLERKHLEKDENYYFLTIDKDRMLDAGPKGNVSRFMNHSCRPNCETQKWTVNGDTRVGLFALEDIPANTEVTFNYNLQCASNEKKQCMCGAPNCSGFIGSKAGKVVVEEKKQRADQKGRKKQRSSMKQGGECFQCGQNGDVIECDNKTCPKKYHLKCVNLPRPSKAKWTCPWHQCNVCKKRRVSKRCILCPKAYCAQHEEGNIFITAKDGYCKEHSQGTDVGSPRSASVVSSNGSDSPQPFGSELSGRGGEMYGEQVAKVSGSKYRTASGQKATLSEADAREGKDWTNTLPTSLPQVVDSGAEGAVRKSSRKSLSLNLNHLQKEVPRKGMRTAPAIDKTNAYCTVTVGGPKSIGKEESGGWLLTTRTSMRRKSSSEGECLDGVSSMQPGGGRALSSSCELFLGSKSGSKLSRRTDTYLTFPIENEMTASSVAGSDSFCEFQESRRKDLIEMRRAQYKRIGQKMRQTKSLGVDLKNLVEKLSPIRS